MTLFYFDGYAVDAVLESDDTAESDVTEFETEEGSDFTDHIRNKSREVSFTVVISNSPLSEVAAERGDPQDGFSFTDEALQVFEVIRNNRQPITIQAPLKTYDKMAMSSLGEPMSVEDGDSQRFIVSFRQIVVVKSQRTTVTIPRAKPRSTFATLSAKNDLVMYAFNAKTNRVAVYNAFAKTWSLKDPNTGKVSQIDGAGFTPMYYDQTTGRWLDNSTNKPISQLPASPLQAGDSHSPNGLGISGDQIYKPFWDPSSPVYQGPTASYSIPNR
jgi:hypothetical protein